MSKKIMVDASDVIYYFVRIEDRLYSHFQHDGYDYLVQARTPQDISKRRACVIAGEKPLLKLANPHKIRDSVNVLGYLPDAMQYMSTLLKDEIKRVRQHVPSENMEDYVLISYYPNTSRSKYVKKRYEDNKAAQSHMRIQTEDLAKKKSTIARLFAGKT